MVWHDFQNKQTQPLSITSSYPGLFLKLSKGGFLNRWIAFCSNIFWWYSKDHFYIGTVHVNVFFKVKATTKHDFRWFWQPRRSIRRTVPPPLPRRGRVARCRVLGQQWSQEKPRPNPRHLGISHGLGWCKIRDSMWCLNDGRSSSVGLHGFMCLGCHVLGW